MAVAVGRAPSEPSYTGASTRRWELRSTELFEQLRVTIGVPRPPPCSEERMQARCSSSYQPAPIPSSAPSSRDVIHGDDRLGQHRGVTEGGGGDHRSQLDAF